MFAELQPLVWIMIGFLLIVAEFFVSGLVLVFFGTAAVATGLAIWIGMPTGHGIPFFVFTALTLGQIYFLRGVFTKWFSGKTFKGSQAREDDEFIGKEARVVSGFADGENQGRVAFRGTQWTARSKESLREGDRVIINGRDGHTFHVSKIPIEPSV